MDTKIIFVFPVERKNTLKAMAKKDGLTMSSFCKNAISEKMRMIEKDNIQ